MLNCYSQALPFSIICAREQYMFVRQREGSNQIYDSFFFPYKKNLDLFEEWFYCFCCCFLLICVWDFFLFINSIKKTSHFHSPIKVSQINCTQKKYKNINVRSFKLKWTLKPRHIFFFRNGKGDHTSVLQLLNSIRSLWSIYKYWEMGDCS